MNIDDFGKFRNESLHQLGKLIEDCERVVRRRYPTVRHDGSQGQEDNILAELLPEASGRYIDVGAAEPVECSNTWKFYQRGWRGVLIEPLPQHWYALMRQRPGDHVIPCAILDTPGFATLRIAGTVSSFRPDWPIDNQSSLMVEAETFENLLKPFPDIYANCDLLSVDVEGTERQVFAGINWDKFRPRAICVEYRKYDSEKPGADLSAEWEPQLKSAGYALHKQTEWNNIYTRA